MDETLAAAMTAADWAEMGAVSQAYDKALQGRETARTVQVRQGDALVTDGQFLESKEVLAGFILIDVADADAAMAVARAIPMARLGAVEVRPVMTFE